MNRKLTALGLALAAALAFSALAAASASAVTDHITAAKEWTPTASAINNQVFRANTNDTTKRFECSAVSATGAQPATTADVTVKPSYTGCKAFSEEVPGGVEATVTTNGCHYTFKGETTTGNATTGEHANVEIKGCEAGKEGITIDVTALKIVCVHIPEQTITHAVRYENGVNEDVVIHATAHTIKSKTTNNNTVCPTGTGGTVEHTNGTYKGDVTVKGHDASLANVPLSVTST